MVDNGNGADPSGPIPLCSLSGSDPKVKSQSYSLAVRPVPWVYSVGFLTYSFSRRVLPTTFLIAVCQGLGSRFGSYNILGWESQ
jgi:hypothetical protein